MAVAKDKIYLDTHHILRVEQHGVMNKTKATHLLVSIRKLSAQLVRQGKQIFILADVRSLKGFEPGTERTGLEIRETVPFVRMAIVVDDGESELTKTSEIITSRSWRKKEISYFNSKTAALKWLKTPYK